MTYTLVLADGTPHAGSPTADEGLRKLMKAHPGSRVVDDDTGQPVVWDDSEE